MKNFRFGLTRTVSLLILFLTVSSLSVNAQAKQNTSTMKDCCMMKDGKMMVMKDGKTMPMEKDMVMKNGTTCMTNGECMMKDGSKMMMKNGDSMDMNGKMCTNKVKKTSMMKDCCMMKDGKMMVMKDGKTMPMEKDMVMKNGTTCMTNGECLMKDGSKMMMKNGDCMDMNGKMCTDKMKKMKKTKTSNKMAAMDYSCPMHPEITSDKPSKCTKCGMDLTKKK